MDGAGCSTFSPETYLLAIDYQLKPYLITAVAVGVLGFIPTSA